jgi:hypothetical protein
MSEIGYHTVSNGTRSSAVKRGHNIEAAFDLTISFDPARRQPRLLGGAWGASEIRVHMRVGAESYLMFPSTLKLGGCTVAAC